MDVRGKLVELLGRCAIEESITIEPIAESRLVDFLVNHGVTVQEWISVKDRLPDNKEHDWVLAQVVEDNGYMHIPRVMEYRQLRNDWFEETYGWLSEHNGLFSVTHWMPLPHLPKETARAITSVLRRK